MITEKELIKMIEDCAERKGIKPPTVTFNAIGNTKKYAILKGGGSLTLETMRRLVEYVENN